MITWLSIQLWQLMFAARIEGAALFGLQMFGFIELILEVSYVVALIIMAIFAVKTRRNR